MTSANEGKDVAYGEMRCVGKKDECKGGFTFSWGRGAFKGITGTTPFVGGINIEKTADGQDLRLCRMASDDLFSAVGFGTCSASLASASEVIPRTGDRVSAAWTVHPRLTVKEEVHLHEQVS